MRCVIKFSYDGSNYSGYARQKSSSNTIQSIIEDNLSIILNKKTKIYASGRTDKGVHAINQFAHFDLDNSFDLDKIKYSLNKMIPNDIYIKDIKRVKNNFNCRYDAIEKTYLYILNNKEYDSIFRNYEIYNHHINLEKLKEIKTVFEGEHCFINFTSKIEDKFDFVRNIKQIKIVIKNKKIYVYFTADGFMKYQVRKIMGTMIAYSEGRISKEKILKYFETKERNIMNFTTYPKGLYLFSVKY
ncbi:MAG: tRNA pseudouridine(38-40) synthase TruA [Bacillales bacterium]